MPDLDVLYLTNTAMGRLEMSLAWQTMPDREKAELSRLLDGYVGFAGCTLARSPGDKDNWIERVGGELPEYICEVAKSIHQKRGLPISRSISIAIGVMKNWSTGRGDVDPDTRAKAAKALAQWEALKARAKVKK